MKPLRLEMQAFGPFARRQVIDFRALGSKTFFLIHGPTGSGKTTILDGMCYALFGDSSGGEREGHQMRSHHAQPDILTEVCFDFLLGADHYRVRRIPEQTRPAKRGGGLTTQAQQAELVRVSNPGPTVPMASGWRDVTDKVSGLLGFESQQFRQVIMLPQGKFRDFLTSKTQERERILQTLFGTELYKRIEESLKRSAAELDRQASTARTQRQSHLDATGVANEAALAEREGEQQAALVARQADEIAAQGAASQAEATLGQGRLVEARFAERDAAQAALARHQAEQPTWQARRTQLAAARKAAQVQPYARAADDANIEASRAAAELHGKRQALEGGIRIKASAAAALELENTRRPEIDLAVLKIGELEALAERVSALATSRAELASASKALAETETRLQGAEKEWAVHKEELQALLSRQQQAQIQAAALAGHQSQWERLRTLVALRKSLYTENRDQTMRVAASKKAVETRDAARLGLTQAKQARERITQAWIAGQAARLAHNLVDGQPCPVCGATAHPAPARGDEALVQDETLRESEAACAAAEGALRQAEDTVATATTAEQVGAERLATLKANLGDACETPITELEARCGEADNLVRQAAESAKWLREAEVRVAQAQAKVAQAEAAVGQIDTQRAQAQLQVTLLQGQVKEKEAGIPAELADPQVLAKAREMADRLLASLRKALAEAEEKDRNASAELAKAEAAVQAAESAFRQAEVRRNATTQELLQRLTAAGFADLAAYRAAVMDDEAVANLEEAIQDFDAQHKAAFERATRAASDVGNLNRPDLTALETRNQEAKAAYVVAAKAVQEIQSALAETRKYLVLLEQTNKKFADLEARFIVLKKVSDVANGVNPERMSFQRYVLATLLEEVLAATTVRLRIMSRGRYEMHRRREPVSLKSAAGLDLEIFDHYTGTARAVSTLSGGESFLASLALALGLSDVVQSYAGGIRLDAIFVDEGFGTLDPESLDFAIRALKDLQQAGRLVGIISHVAELKEWIDARLELKATQAGSVAEFVG